MTNKIVPLFSVINKSIDIIKTPKGEKPLVFLRIDYRFMDVDTGEFIGGQFMSAGHSRDDKGFYAAVTGAIKYILTSSFLIPTGDDPEVDYEEDNKKKNEPAPSKQTKKTPNNKPEHKNITEDQRKLMFAEIGDLYMSLHEHDPVQFPKDKERTDEFRKVCLLNSVGIESSKDMDMTKLDTFLKVIDKFKNAVKKDPASLATLLFKSKNPLSVLKEKEPKEKEQEEKR